MLWVMAACSVAGRAAAGIGGRFGLVGGETLLSGCFLCFLLVVGFQVLDWIATRGRRAGEALGLPLRRGWAGEFGLGAAIGWGLALVSVLPVLLTLNLHGRLLPGVRSWEAALVAVASLAVLTLACELIARGYAFRRLVAALGPTAASGWMAVGFAVVMVWSAAPRHPLVGLVAGTVLGLLLAMAALRTEALWVGWGLGFTYRAVIALALGLPVVGRSDFSSLVDGYTTGPRWLTGGDYGLDGALLTVAVLLAGMAIVFRATREYAWVYTYRPIVAAGYEVAVAPPAAHTAMEREAAAPALVQILASTPQTRSVVPPPPVPPPPFPSDEPVEH